MEALQEQSLILLYFLYSVRVALALRTETNRGGAILHESFHVFDLILNTFAIVLC